jgi:hypothetical protein
MMPYGLLATPTVIVEVKAVPIAPFAELLIDCEEDRTLLAVLVGMLREDRLSRLESSNSSRSWWPASTRRPTMTASKFMGSVLAGRGHDSEQLGRD